MGIQALRIHLVHISRPRQHIYTLLSNTFFVSLSAQLRVPSPKCSAPSLKSFSSFLLLLPSVLVTLTTATRNVLPVDCHLFLQASAARALFALDNLPTQFYQLLATILDHNALSRANLT